MQNVTLEEAGGWVHEASLCSIFAIHYKSIIISYLKGKKQNNNRKNRGIQSLDVSWALVLVSWPFWEVEGLSIYGKNGGSAPWSSHLKQHYFSRCGEAWGPHGPQEKWLLWEPLICNWRNPSCPWIIPQAARASSFRDTCLAQEVLPFSSAFTFSFKATSHLRLLLVRLRRTIRTRSRGKERDRTALGRPEKERRLCEWPLGNWKEDSFCLAGRRSSHPKFLEPLVSFGVPIFMELLCLIPADFLGGKFIPPPNLANLACNWKIPLWP